MYVYMYIYRTLLTQYSTIMLAIYTVLKKKVVQHDFDRLYFFNHGSIRHVSYHWKAHLFAFLLINALYLLWLFHWGMSMVSQLGAMSKMKSCKIWLDCKKVVLHVLCPISHAYMLPYRNLPWKQNIINAEFQILVQFGNISFLTSICPQFTHPRCTLQWSNQNK